MSGIASICAAINRGESSVRLYEDEMRDVIDALDAAETAAGHQRTRADAAEAERDYWRAQATAAAPCVDAVRALTLRLIPGGTGCAVDPERVVAAVEGLRAECDRIDRLASRQAGEYMEAAHGLASELDAARRAATFAEMERDTLRGLSDALRADNVRLRAIVEGREHPPTPDEAEAHYRAGGGWLYARAEGCRASVAAVPMTVRSIACAADYQRETLRWWPLDATGRPCPWPTALDAGGEVTP